MRCFLFLIFTCPIYLTAQSLIQLNCIDEEKRICTCSKGSHFSLEDALTIIEADTIRDFRRLACYHHQIGTKFHTRYPEKALYHYNKSLKLRKQYDRANLWKSYYVISDIYRTSENIDKALKNIRKAHETKGYKTAKDSINILKSIAKDLKLVGEDKEAIQYAEMAIQINIDSIRKAGAYNILCSILLKKEKDTYVLKQALSYADSAILYYNNNPNIVEVYNNKGMIYGWLREYDKAFDMYKLSLNQAIDDLFKAKVLNNIATEFKGLYKHQQAIETLNQSLQLKEAYYENAPFQYVYAANHENLAENHEALGNIGKALKHYQLALINLTDNFRNKDINTSPKVTSNYYVYNKPYLLQALDLKAQAAIKSGNIDLAYDTYQVLDEWINELYKDLSTKASKLTWIARAHDTYAHAIEVALAKKDKEKAFEYAEKAHAVLLWQSLSQQAARNLLSEDDKEKMDDLTAQIRQADQQYRYDEVPIETLRTLERKQEALEKTFDEQYPDYAQRKYQPEATTVSDVQSNIIDNQTAFIEYYRTDETLYIFTITKNGLEITQENANGLANDITNFVNNISGKSGIENDFNPDQNEPDIPITLRSSNNISLKKTDIESYHALAHKLYKQLIPVAIRSNDDINRLVIVPDREIGMLPFAALTTEATSGKLNKNTPFLVKKYTINYLYSAGSYLQLQQKKADQKYCFAGIAPLEYTHGNWEKLPNSEEELNEIKTLHWSWSRDVLMQEQATKAEFERIIKEGYRTIQISTHAVFDENKGRIIFHDSALTQDEIDQLEINTHRLILSACETGVGIQNQGEGILSLGWNFAYKGVPSITMSHWSVSDNSTKDIMIHYHKNLNEGVAADKALQNAQQYYLENIISDTQANPRYWAAFFHTGNVR